MARKHKFGRVFDRLEPLVLRPCEGWRHLGICVYEHKSGIRIHVGGGLIKMPSSKFYQLDSVIGRMGYELIKINGGNKKRGLMAWAMNCIPQNTPDELPQN